MATTLQLTIGCFTETGKPETADILSFTQHPSSDDIIEVAYLMHGVEYTATATWNPAKRQWVPRHACICPVELTGIVGKYCPDKGASPPRPARKRPFWSRIAERLNDGYARAMAWLRENII